jgi:hypothetical protein
MDRGSGCRVSNWRFDGKGNDYSLNSAKKRPKTRPVGGNSHERSRQQVYHHHPPRPDLSFPDIPCRQGPRTRHANEHALPGTANHVQKQIPKNLLIRSDTTDPSFPVTPVFPRSERHGVLQAARDLFMKKMKSVQSFDHFCP